MAKNESSDKECAKCGGLGYIQATDGLGSKHRYRCGCRPSEFPTDLQHSGDGDAKSNLLERTAQIVAHRVCCGTEHDAANGKLHGYCVVCGVPWPCKYAGKPPPAPLSATTSPIPMVLYCPNCGAQHIDKPQPDKGWTNPPHRSHECQSCGCVWRPADVLTNGVAAIQTIGKRDWPAFEGQRDSALAVLPEEERKIEPFVVKHYAGMPRPSIKGNGFDGLEVGEDREEAEDFVKWLNDRLGIASPRREPVDGG